MPQPPPPDNAAFKRVTVDYLVPGGARIAWTLNPHLNDPTPATYSFQLQVSQSGVPTATDWANVGAALVNAYTTTDPSQRIFGKTMNMSYRVILTTTLGTYTSDIADILGHLSFRDWRLAREILRKEQKRHSIYTSIDCYFYKALRFGTPSGNIDSITGEIIDSGFSGSYGTGFVGGYYAPVPATFADMEPSKTREMREMQARGTVKDNIISARLLGVLPPIQGDAFVSKDTDERWYVHSVQEAVTMRSVPLVYTVELRAAPFTDPLYLVPRP